MKNPFSPWQFLSVLVLLVPSLYLWHLWPSLPAQVPTHFGLDGQPNGYSERSTLWLLTLGLPLGTLLLFTVLPRLDPKRRLDGAGINYQKLGLAVVAMTSSLAGYVLYAAVHPGTDVGQGVTVLVGLSFAFMGNYLTTVQPNYFIGIRTPWTLESPTVWARTHRVGGIAFCVAGLLIAGLALVLSASLAHMVLITFILLTVGFAYVYSYLVFRQEEQARKAA